MNNLSKEINKIIGFNNLIKLIPYNLKPNSKIEKQCPFCNSKIEISKTSNGHIWIVCEKEGVLLCQ